MSCRLSYRHVFITQQGCFSSWPTCLCTLLLSHILSRWWMDVLTTELKDSTSFLQLHINLSWGFRPSTCRNAGLHWFESVSPRGSACMPFPKCISVALHALSKCVWIMIGTRNRPSLHSLVGFALCRVWYEIHLHGLWLPGFRWRAWLWRARCLISSESALQAWLALTLRSSHLPHTMCLC